ncbi:T9SS type A sorting domain-containing protein [Hymenobacter sp. ASUV-10]|uniref:T9SS type A sorting domain-containing protein n=1 Tax=Hymenobacter aranciens TaxID=3063996 RepID=A0ABT9BAM7_9BACT|nr:T9SS type A sorting domain-containing protein [Hymenobacter sp. ASUV-10]MDO7875325.1 T9SS type A sorting domain-containing protein [Hymenobacter sp. ASUV-10]
MQFIFSFLRLRASVLIGGMLAAAALAATPARAQEAGHCLLLPLAPAERAQRATLVVEAEVRSSEGFWNAAHTRLFTRHRLRVFSLLKGAVADTTELQLITEGGRLGLQQQLLTNTLRLEPGQQGVFFLSRAAWAGLPAPGQHWAAYGSEQGFIEYHPADGTASEPFRQYPAIDAAFYQQITQLTGQPRRVLQPNPALAPSAGGGQARPQALGITGLSPLSLAAGAEEVLTIDGQDFGLARGTGFVEFRNADDGGATWIQARATDYLSWTSTRIRVRVPSSGSGGHPAGSGRVRITTSSQARAESPESLTVIYALTNVASTDDNYLQRPNHVVLNDDGGLSFRFGPSFAANAAASAAWQRALTNWRCNTGVNWQVGALAPTNAIAGDDQNVIAFDTPADELPAQVLGRTTSYYSGCFGADGQVVFSVSEIDMQFDAQRAFQFGPAPAVRPQIDFETTAVHELGHAQQLTHLNLPGAVMHFGIAPGQNTRALNPASDIVGGRRVLRERSFRQQTCGPNAMLPAPLRALRIDVTDPNGGVNVRWDTRDECFLIGFVVQRSAGADTTAWQTLVTGPATPGSYYGYADRQPMPGLHYYRIGVRRPDGSVDYAAPVPISTGEVNPGVALFPNPVVGDVLRLQYPAGAEGSLSFRIYDELGRLVRRSSGSARVGLNVLSLDATGLAPGFYVLRWTDAQGREGNRRFSRL